MENKANNIEIEKLVLRYWEGTLSAAEKQQLQEWISASKENLELFEGYLSILLASGVKSDLEDSNIKAIDSWKKIAVATKEPKRFTLRKVISIAIAACLMGVFTIIGLNQNRNAINEEYAFSTSKELSEQLLLPDGSSVWLNKESSIRYSGNNDRRTVWLEGEGFFEVKTDSLRSFEVHAGSALTRVLGTSFNIDARTKGEVRIRVASGKVSFEQESNAEATLILEKGEQAISNEKESVLQQLEDVGENISVWQKGMLNFDKVSLNSIADELLIYAGINLVFEDPTIGGCLLTAQFNLNDLQLFEEILQFSLDLEVEKEDEQTWIIKGKGCE